MIGESEPPPGLRGHRDESLRHESSTPRALHASTNRVEQARPGGRVQHAT
jgi:hypothetical protein